MAEDKKRYRVLPTAELTEEHQKYWAQIGRAVGLITIGVVDLQFDDGRKLTFDLEELEEVE